MVSSVTATRETDVMNIWYKKKDSTHFPYLKKFMFEVSGEENFESLPFLDDTDSQNSKGTFRNLVQLNQ
jgi:hypothetical protein